MSDKASGVGGEAGDTERRGQLEIDVGPAVLRRTQVNTEYSEHYTSLTFTLPALLKDRASESSSSLTSLLQHLARTVLWISGINKIMDWQATTSSMTHDIGNNTSSVLHCPRRILPRGAKFLDLKYLEPSHSQQNERGSCSNLKKVLITQSIAL